jgi:hypothetical protein
MEPPILVYRNRYPALTYQNGSSLMVTTGI